MTADLTDISAITGYHAHVYFDPDADSASAAKRLREEVTEAFSDIAYIGNWHDKPVGPHTTGSYMVAFKAEFFGKIVPWLSLHNPGLSILIHPETGDDLKDHRDYPLWLGQPIDLDLSKL